MLLLLLGSVIPCAVITLALWHPVKRETICRLLHHRLLNSIIFFMASLCFLGKFSHLGEADLGHHRKTLQFFFCVMVVSLICRNYGFLAARGIVILQLLWANEILNALSGRYEWIWCMAKVLVYGVVLMSFYLAVAPYQLRNWWLREKRRTFPAKRKEG